MLIQTKATGLTLTPDIEAYFSKKVQSLEKLVEGDSMARLSVEIARTTAHHEKGDVFRAEFNLYALGKNFRAVSETSDVMAALDLAKDELVEALRSHKGKRQTMIRRGAQRVKDMLRGMNPWG